MNVDRFRPYLETRKKYIVCIDRDNFSDHIIKFIIHLSQNIACYVGPKNENHSC